MAQPPHRPGLPPRYREFHGLPHLIGYVHDGADGRDLVVARFVTTADTTFRPRVPEKGVDLHVLDSRHGRVIFRKIGKGWLDESSLIIWDPVADHHQEVPRRRRSRRRNSTSPPPSSATPWDATTSTATAARSAWCSSASATRRVRQPLPPSTTPPPPAPGPLRPPPRPPSPTRMTGDFACPHLASWWGTTLYFRSPGRILRYWFGDEMEHLSYVDIPPFITQETRGTVLMPAADGRLSFAAMYGDMTISFWETEVSADGAVDWVHTQNALVSIPYLSPHRAAASLLFVRTEDGGIVSVQVGNGRFQMLPQPAPAAADICSHPLHELLYPMR